HTNVTRAGLDGAGDAETAVARWAGARRADPRAVTTHIALQADTVLTLTSIRARSAEILRHRGVWQVECIWVNRHIRKAEDRRVDPPIGCLLSIYTRSARCRAECQEQEKQALAARTHRAPAYHFLPNSWSAGP